MICTTPQPDASTHLLCVRRSHPELLKIEQDIKELETQYESSASRHLLAEVRDHVIKYNERAEQQLRFLTKRCTTRAYGEGDTPGRHLATKIKEPWANTYITKVKGEDGVQPYTTPEILTTFAHYYENLYKSRSSTTVAKINEYLDDIALAWLTAGQRADLAQPLTEEEIKEAVGSPQMEKPLGQTES
ncbi:hypothetical protein NDU88_001319 [Pleurodeles waltl]|uniref:Uncharacterized protein n=1 Tax=Pleurodeles waltl TaxID=8319 RepID=A0AAV7U6W1_PLEWA|nr:hypothetical protein NDU88_001319 [Pleurodeles waltl]